MQQIENEFAWDMRRFDAMDEQERMMLVDRLNREMARLERELGDAAFETHLALTLANQQNLMALVAEDPDRWSQLVRAMGGIDTLLHYANKAGAVVGAIRGLMPN
jgi:hypothetical protein